MAEHRRLQLSRWQLPLEGYGTKATALATSAADDAIHVLASTSPTPSLITVHGAGSNGGQRRRCTTLPLRQSGGFRGLGGGFGGDVGASPSVVSLHGGKMLCVHLPRTGQILLLNPADPASAEVIVSVPGIAPAPTAAGVSARKKKELAAMRMYRCVAR